MGGGDSGPTSNTTYTQAIPPELMPYATKMLGYGESLSYDKPLGQQYPGQTTAGFNPLQQQAIGSIQGMQPSQYLGQGAALAGMAGTSQFTGDTAQQYMNPYTSTMQQAAVRDYARQLPGMGVNAARAGAMGGTRSALLQAEGQRNLQNQLQDIQAKAYESGRNQFNTQNQNMLAAAGQLGQFGTQDYAQQAGIAQAQMGAGNALQTAEQNRLNAAYQQWVNTQMEPYQRLNFMSSLIRGTPIQNVGSAMYQQPPSTMSQVIGAGTGIAGLSQAFGGSGTKPAREGGSTKDIKGYAGGGIVSLAGGGNPSTESTQIEKMGAINASMDQLSKTMPTDRAAAQVQQTVKSIPQSTDWQDAYDLLNYTKAHPVTPQPVNPDSVVVQMAKQIAAQSDAKKMAEMQQAQQAQQQQMAMQQMQQAQQQQPPMPQQGVAGLPAQNVGQNYTDAGITAEPQEASDQQAPTMQAAEGGGIADLKSNVGEHYATGGIVAFQEGGWVPDGQGGWRWQAEAPGTEVTKSVLASESEMSNVLKNPNLKSGAEQFGENIGRYVKSGYNKLGGVKGVLGKGALAAPLAMELFSPDEAKEAYQDDPNISAVEKLKQAGLDIAPETLGTAGAIVGGTAGTVASGGNPLVGFGAGTAGYYGGQKLAQAILPENTANFDKWYKEVWLPNHPEGGTAQQVTTAANAAGVDVDKNLVAKYLSGTSTGAKIYSAPKVSVGAAPDVMEGVEKPKSTEELTDAAMKLREKYGIGAAAKNFVNYLDKREAELAGDEKFNRGLALANFGFKLMSTPGSLAKGLGAAGPEYVQGMMALKKEENAAKLGLYQAKMQAESAIEQGKAGAIDSAANQHDAQLTRYFNAKNAQAGLTAQYTGLDIQAQGQADTAAYQKTMAGIAAGELDLNQEKSKLQIAFQKAVLAGDKPAQAAILDAIKKLNEASTSYLTKSTGLDATARQKLLADNGFRAAYKIYTNEDSSAADRAKALTTMRQVAYLANISSSDIDAMLGIGTSRGTLD